MANGRWELILPQPLSRWVPSRPWLTIREGRTPAIRMGSQEKAITLLDVSWQSAEMLDQFVGHLVGDRLPLLVVGSTLKAELRDRLEQRGLGYLDAKGHLHLVAPGLLVHLGEPAPTRERVTPGAGTLGAHGVRAVQAVLEEPEPISVTELAVRARLSLAQTHTVLSQLERAGLIRSTGFGPAKRRMVTDRSELLDWLARQPAARRRETFVDAALYERKPEELWMEISSTLGRAGIRHAITGAAAASLFGVGPTSVALSRVRIDPAVRLEDAVKAMGAERTDRAPNVRVFRDTGEVGVTGSAIRNRAWISPKVRIYLDCLSERRGEDIAQQFRERVLAY